MVLANSAEVFAHGPTIPVRSAHGLIPCSVEVVLEDATPAFLQTDCA